MLISLLYFLSFAYPANLANAVSPTSLLDSGSHCVAYRVEKTMLFFKKDSVIGKNCDISAQVLPDLGGLYHVEVVVPIKSFQSESVERDYDVAKTLRVDVKPDLVFHSKALTPEAWQALFAKSYFEIEGDLNIGDKDFPVKIPAHYVDNKTGGELDAVATVRFENFSISPPSVAIGLIAKSGTDFELHIHLLASRILGADSIRPRVTVGHAQ